MSDQDALSPTYTSNGHTYGPKEGLTVMSGVIDLGGGAGSKRMSSSTTSTQNFGSSHAKSTERWQWYYDGAAYASGKDDYKVKSSNPLKRYDVKRVVQVCFKYTRDSKDVIGWQCSNASLGPTFAPGKVVKKTVHDTINPVAAKTQFHYSIKTI